MRRNRKVALAMKEVRIDENPKPVSYIMQGCKACYAVCMRIRACMPAQFSKNVELSAIKGVKAIVIDHKINVTGSQEDDIKV